MLAAALLSGDVSGRLWPQGTRVILEREGKSKLLIVIPPQGITMSSAGTGAFAVAWNGFVAFWTASALAAGGGLLMAAFSIPFWFAGSSVAKTAFEAGTYIHPTLIYFSGPTFSTRRQSIEKLEDIFCVKSFPRGW